MPISRCHLLLGDSDDHPHRLGREPTATDESANPVAVGSRVKRRGWGAPAIVEEKLPLFRERPGRLLRIPSQGNHTFGKTVATRPGHIRREIGKGVPVGKSYFRLGKMRA